MRLRATFQNSSGTGRSAQSTTKANLGRQEGRTGPAPSPAARNLALAHHIERLIERGVITDYTQAARILGVSQPRITRLMGLMLVAPAIQEAILLGKVAPKDKELRVLARLPAWQAQGASIRTINV